MSSWEKLLTRIRSLDKDMRFDELKKVLEEYGYIMKMPRSGSSHATFRKSGLPPLPFQGMNRSKEFMLKWSDVL